MSVIPPDRRHRYGLLLIAMVGGLFCSSDCAASVSGSDNLAAAIERKDFNEAERLLASEVDVNQPQADGTTALHWAVFHRQHQLIERLLERGASPDDTNEFDVSPLELAAKNGDGKAITLLLNSGATPDPKRKNAESPLMFAARNGRPEAIHALLAAGADANAAAQHGQTALMWAAAEGHVEAVKLLLESGAKPDVKLKSGFTPFFFAVRQGHQEVVDVFLDQGTDVNAPMKPERGGRLAIRDGTSALVLAIENGHFELAERLLEAGADPNDQRTKWAPLHMLSYVRKPNRGDGEDGQPAPQGSGQLSSLQFVEVLIQHGAEINLQLDKNPGGGINKRGATPFFVACDTADVPLMKKLLDHGANPLLTNADQTTTLMVAAGLGTYAPGEEAGTEDEAIAAVRLLLDLKADLNAVDENGETAMHGAAYKNLPKMVKFLHENGAKFEIWNRPNRRGWTPFDLAEGYRPGNFKPAPDTLKALQEIAPSKQ